MTRPAEEFPRFGYRRIQVLMERQGRVLGPDKALLRWAADQDPGVAPIDPGKPWQNGMVESFNGKFRDEACPWGIPPSVLARHL